MSSDLRRCIGHEDSNPLHARMELPRILPKTPAGVVSGRGRRAASVDELLPVRTAARGLVKERRETITEWIDDSSDAALRDGSRDHSEELVLIEQDKRPGAEAEQMRADAELERT